MLEDGVGWWRAVGGKDLDKREGGLDCWWERKVTILKVSGTRNRALAAWLGGTPVCFFFFGKI